MFLQYNTAVLVFLCYDSIKFTAISFKISAFVEKKKVERQEYEQQKKELQVPSIELLFPFLNTSGMQKQTIGSSNSSCCSFKIN